MTEDEMTAAVALLVAARRGGKPIERLNVTPASVAQGHAIQDRVAARLGEAVGGFKANAPPGEPPVRGAIYRRAILASPALLAPGAVPLLGVEGEIAFRFLSDLPARDADYALAEVIGTLAALPAIEVVSGRLTDPWSRPALEQLADCLNNGALVLGAERPDWRVLNIAQLPVTAQVNGVPVVQQTGGHPIGDPLAVVLALVNIMRHQKGIIAGQVVTTGSCTGIRFLKPGDHFSVEFAGLGQVEAGFGPA